MTALKLGKPAGFGAFAPAAMIGAIAGIDNITTALAMSALLFSGPIASGMGLGVGVILLGGILISLIVALRSVVPNTVALVQETTIAILAAAIVSMTMQSTGSTETKIATAIAIIGASSIATGVLFWITGRLKLGGMVRFLPYPVVAGFLAGSGWLLMEGGAIMLTGHEFGIEFAQALGQPETLWLLLPGLGFALVMSWALDRFSSSTTMPLVMILAATVFYAVLYAFDIPVETVRELGYLPQVDGSDGIDLPTLDLLAQTDWWAVLNAGPSILVVAGLSMIGLMLSVSGLELAIGRDIDVNAELRSSGLANLFAGGVGGVSGFVGLSMTVLAEKNGAKGRGPGIMTAVVMLAGLLLAGPLIFQVPVFLTGGFVLYLGFKLVEEWFLHTRHRMPLSEWLIVAVIVLSVAVIGFMEGLAVGLVVSSGVFVFKYSRLPVVRQQATGVEQRSTVDRSPAAIKYLSDHGSAIEVVQLQGYLFFGTADRVVDLVRHRLAAKDKPPLRFIVLDFRNVSGADSAAITCFLKIFRLVQPGEICVSLTAVPPELKVHLDRAGLKFGAGHLMKLDVDLDHALEKAEEAILREELDLGEGKDLLNHFVAAIGPHPRLPDLINTMTRLEMQPEDVLIKQGEDANDVFFVASGRVRVQIILPNGQPLRVRTMLGGAVVGEIALYLNQPRSADVIVDAPSEIFRLSAADFDRLEREDAELFALAHRLLASNLSEKLAVANKMIQLTQK